QKKEREPEELVTRFFAYSDGLEGYRDDVSPFIFRYIKRMNESFKDNADLAQQYRERFSRMLSFVEQSFRLGFKKTVKGSTTPRTRFESIAIGSHLALEINGALQVTKEQTDEILESDSFKAEIRSDGANAIRRLQGRIGYIRDALLERA
ncbi:hypothetical protein F2279_24500, partial [Salmonella enterica]|nr:hypothetical protein [Salmonella enterica]